MSGTLGRLTVVASLLVGGWGLFYNEIDVVLSQDYLDDGSVIDRVEHCGTMYDVLTGKLDESITGGVDTDLCVRSARADAFFGGLLVGFFLAVGVLMMSSSYRRPLIGMDAVRPLPSGSVFHRRQAAHHRRAAELAGSQDDD
jgi:hypothetical protein